jgi:hypothetical protein
MVVTASVVRRVEHPNPLRLLTLGAEHGAWDGGPLPDAHGAIVRVVPPANATDESIGVVLDRCRALGVAAVKLLPRAAGDVAVVPEVARAARRSHRAVVDELVQGAEGVDREALARAVGATMDEEGL